MKNKLEGKKYIQYILIAVFFIYLYLQFATVMIYYDDYGYYSLSYGIQTDFKGHAYTLTQLLEFLKEHYFHANGRLLYFFIWLFIYNIGGLKLVQIAAAIIVVFIFYLIYKIIESYSNYAKENAVLLVLLCFISYGIMEISILRFGMYWFVAMFLYVSSLLPFLLFQVIYIKWQTNGVAKKIILLLLIFMSSWSQESWSVSTICFTVFLLAYEWKMNNVSKWNIGYIVAAMMGFGILISSPGIQLRAAEHDAFYALNIFEKIKSCLPCIMYLFNKMRRFQLVFWITQIILSIYICKNEKNKFRVIFDYFYIICILIKLFSYFFVYRKTEIVNNVTYIQLSDAFTYFLIFCMLVQVTRYYISKEKVIPLFIFYSTFISIGCLVVVPEMPDRLFLPLIILSNILNLDIIINYLSTIKNKLQQVISKTCILASFIILCLPNMFHIYWAYADNAKVWNSNKVKIENVASANEWKQPNYVILQKLPHVEYAGEMLYSGVADFMKVWICNYYNLPYEFEFIYYD